MYTLIGQVNGNKWVKRYWNWVGARDIFRTIGLCGVDGIAYLCVVTSIYLINEVLS